MEHGTCKLCQLEKHLLDSHYLPKRAYSMNMARSLKNPNPVRIAHGMAMQVSDQLRGPTFCEDCERLFSTNGEQWTLGNLPKDYKEPFPLQDALVPEAPIVIAHNINVYAGSKIAAFDLEQLIFFGMSIFWRAASRQWKSSQGAIAPAVDLGEHYEPIRKYLLGGPFPDDVFLSISIHSRKPVPSAMFPVLEAENQAGKRLYWFYIDGLGFRLTLGEEWRSIAGPICAVHNASGPIVVDQGFDAMVDTYIKDMLVAHKMSSGLLEFLENYKQVKPAS
jgi:hypothetical protein